MILPLDSDLGSVVDRDYWDVVSRDKVLQRAEFDRCRMEPWYMLVNYVWTIKRDDLVHSSVERFPADEYLRYVLHKCFVESLLAIDKSRQMRMTWLMMFYELHNAMYNENELIICQTKKKDDVDEELIKRAYFMWKHLPDWLRPECERNFCKLSFNQMNSYILGIPSGADQIRSHNPNRYLADEGGFFEGDFEECRTAAVACATDIKVVSTANAGDWEDFIEDRIAA